MTLRPVNNPAAGGAQRTRTGRHFSGMSRRDLAFVHLHRPVKAAHLKAIVRAALEHDPEKRIPVFSNLDISRIYFRTGISRDDHFIPAPFAAARTRLRSPSKATVGAPFMPVRCDLALPPTSAALAHHRGDDRRHRPPKK